MAIAEITVIPVGTASTSLSAYVADIHRYLTDEQAKGAISFELTAMSTIVEGEFDELLRIIRGMHELPFASGAQRVCTSVKFDDRRDKQGSVAQKLRSVADKLD
ncbi:MTH1187 family thiamine-binding protein [Paenibacillus sp. tmac-D7]|uniref:MTH1187 family thiamine-binding protein n=1 Tax=Paenibacillus sp. tmac-D7 TaxID=2591462 RepID=UPI0011438017|nr:MTH1187 family thiamine-binding protein [Paenibacillus sp. tmac-D7]